MLAFTKITEPHEGNMTQQNYFCVYWAFDNLSDRPYQVVALPGVICTHTINDIYWYENRDYRKDPMGNI